MTRGTSSFARWAPSLIAAASVACVVGGSRENSGAPALPDPYQDCAVVTKRAPPNLHWEDPSPPHPDRATVVSFDDLTPTLNGQWVRLSGVLHVQFDAALVESTSQEWFVLFSSWPKGGSVPASEWLYLQLSSLPPRDTYWIGNQSRISDRCVAVEGQFEVLRSGGKDPWRQVNYVRSLSVWSEPHRPLSIPPQVLPPPLLDPAP